MLAFTNAWTNARISALNKVLILAGKQLVLLMTIIVFTSNAKTLDFFPVSDLPPYFNDQSIEAVFAPYFIKRLNDGTTELHRFSNGDGSDTLIESGNFRPHFYSRPFQYGNYYYWISTDGIFKLDRDGDMVGQISQS